MLAVAAFYYPNPYLDPDSAKLCGAHASRNSYVGNAAAAIFALASTMYHLLKLIFQACLSVPITCTLAGQVVSEVLVQKFSSTGDSL